MGIGGEALFDNFLGSYNYLRLSKSLMRLLGKDATIFLTELFNCYEYEHQGVDEGYIYMTEQCMKEQTTLTPLEQEDVIKYLKYWCIIKTKGETGKEARMFQISSPMLEEVLEIFLEAEQNDKAKEEGEVQNA